MDAMGRETYDDFYVAYFNSKGELLYPTDLEDARIIKKLLKNGSDGGYVFPEDRDLRFRVRIKRKVINDETVQIMELSNVTEYFNQLSSACVDEITHLNNRKIARNLLMQYIDIAYRNDESFAIIMADLDGFKNVNDTYGHTTGDLVLSEVSRILFCRTRQESYRSQDIVARLGGDEFIIILKNISESVAIKRAENIREEVESKEVTVFSEENIVEKVKAGTLSIGLYYVTPKDLKDLFDKGNTTDEVRQVLIDRCDSALYSSKNNGKNKVTTFAKDKVLKLEL